MAEVSKRWPTWVTARLTRARLLAAIAGVVAGTAAIGPAFAQASAQFTYRVTHSVFGDIGTYTNTVEPNRDGITVETRVHFEGKMLGVRMYREEAERIERWQGDRLGSFHCVTGKVTFTLAKCLRCGGELSQLGAR